jgi:hypothetical protein
MSAVLPLQPRLVRQPHVGFVNEVVRLERALAVLAVQLSPGEPKQIIVDDRNETV